MRFSNGTRELNARLAPLGLAACPFRLPDRRIGWRIEGDYRQIVDVSHELAAIADQHGAPICVMIGNYRVDGGELIGPRAEHEHSIFVRLLTLGHESLGNTPDGDYEIVALRRRDC